MELLDGSGESIEKIGMDSAMLVQCGGGEFDHFTATGGHFGQRGTAVIERTDFWDAKRKLFTRCRNCDEVLYKHPDFDLLFEYDDGEDAVIRL